MADKKEREFRKGDRVTVHGLIETSGIPVPGRVVCDNRKSKYGETVLILADIPDRDYEKPYTFQPDGRRYLPGSSTYLTLGHPKGGADVEPSGA